MPLWSLPITVLAGSLALTACGGGGASQPPSPTNQPPSPTNQPPSPTNQPPSPTNQPPSPTTQPHPPPPPPPSPPHPTNQPPSSASQTNLPPGAPLVSDQYSRYTLARADETSITELVIGSGDWATSDLRQLDSTEGTGNRDDFNTVDSPLPDDSTFTRYGFWGQHGYAAVVIGEESRQITDDELTWSGPFQAAYAWASGEPTGANPTGTGSATWRGIAKAASTADFQRLTGTANLSIPDLSQPQLTVEIDLDKNDGSTAELRWSDVSLTNGSFSQGSAGDQHIQGRFHGQDHSEAWGIFQTNAYVGAFGAKRQPQQ